jgi:hypothetical protein
MSMVDALRNGSLCYDAPLHDSCVLRQRTLAYTQAHQLSVILSITRLLRQVVVIPSKHTQMAVVQGISLEGHSQTRDFGRAVASHIVSDSLAGPQDNFLFDEMWPEWRRFKSV